MANFRTRARAVDLLGKQQIRDEVTALSELLRNSYDADADEGLIDVNTTKNRILIWDDGDGMNKDDIMNNWLTLGTYSKKSKKIIRTRKGRIKIGEKGIGRLAISLLGDQLLILSKKKFNQNTNNPWALLYLHWALFRNENLFLEEIEVPVLEFESTQHIIEFLQNDFHLAKDILLKNFENKVFWNTNEHDIIIKNIQSFVISDEIISRTRQIEKNGGGTMFYVDEIDNTWDWNNYSVQTNEENLIRKKQRLKDLLFSFRNFIDIFDNQLVETEEAMLRSKSEKQDNFIPKIHVNGIYLENSEALNADDVGLFDYALKGVIKNGGFLGNAFIGIGNSPEEVNVTHEKLTHGMANMKDCGPIKIKWFYVEGTSNLSSIPADQHTILTDKLDQIGGIYVFRDGLRILPYGEVDNDFLNVEKRRTKRAGTWLFSFRRMYGYIEISKEANEFLVDKSSREGFIENEYFNYFRTVLINLLQWWAVDYLETKSNDGKRSKYIEGSKEKAEFNRKRDLESIEEKKYFTRLDRWVTSFEIKSNELEKNLKSQIDRLTESFKKRINTNEISESELTRIKFTIFQIVESVNEIKWEIQSRYEHEVEIRELVENFNEEIEFKKEELKKYADNNIQSLINIINENLVSEKDHDYHWIIEQVDERVEWLSASYIKNIKEIDKNNIKLFENYVHSITNEINMIIESEIENAKKEFINSNGSRIQILINDLISLRSRLNNHNRVTEEIRIEFNQLMERYHLTSSDVRSSLVIYQDTLNNSSVIRKLKKMIITFTETIENKDKWNYDGDLIGKLKTELTTYRDLSALGLATELTDHEFNSVYSNLKENLNKLSIALGKTKLMVLLNGVNTGFKSLEKLHERMSPLYRQSRHRKINLSLKEYIENVLVFFNSDIDRYGITIHNNIPSSFFIKEAEVVLFTPLVNLVSNSIYWMLNSEIKELHFYLSDDHKHLYIHDTGPGISDRDVERVFEPFFSKKVEGRGLGLFLSKDILNAKGHDLSLLSNYEKSISLKGACFSITFNNNSLLGV